MLLKLADHIRYAQERALQCAERAERANDPASRVEWRDIERGWQRLAESYMLVERREAFLVDANKRAPL
jgi:hypothetical protein